MIYSIASILDILFNLLELTIFIDFIASWIPNLQGNKIINIIHEFINPILEPIRSLQNKLIPGAPVDFSPMIALFVIDFLKRILI